MKNKLVVILVMATALLAACAGQPFLVNPIVPVSQTDQADADQSAAEQTADAADESASQRFHVVVATYLLDNAGLHGLDERLNGEGVIEASDAGKISRIRGVLAVTPWPAELQPMAAQLIEKMDALNEALTADDAETAAPLATEVHDVGHDLSHEVGEWLGEAGGASE
jgi:hypothetical protein